MAQIVDAAGRVTYRAGRFYGSPEDLAKLGIPNSAPPPPPPQPRPAEPPKVTPFLPRNEPLAQPALVQPKFTPLLQPAGLSEGIFNDLAAGKSTEQVAQERGMTREAVIAALAGGNAPVVTPPTSDNGDVRTTVINDAQGRTVTEHYDFQQGTYYTTVQNNPHSAPVANPVRDELGWKVEQTHNAQTGTNTRTRIDDLDTGNTVVETSHGNGAEVKATVFRDETSNVVVTGPDGRKVELAPWQSAPGRPDQTSHLVRPPHLQNFIGPVAAENMRPVGGDQSIPSIEKELAEGRSLDDIAETRGISRDQVVAGMQAAGMTVKETQTSVGHVVEVTEPQSGQTTTYTRDYDHDSTGVTFTKPNGNSTSDSVDGNGVTTHTERNAETGALTTREVDPKSNSTTDTRIDEDGRKTEIVTVRAANGKEEKTTTVTFNGYRLTTAPDGKKTLTNSSNGDQQAIKPGSLQDAFATMLMEATPNSKDPAIARQGLATKAFAESQLAQDRLPEIERQATAATQSRIEAERKYGTGRPTQPTLNPDGKVIDPIGAPPQGSSGQLNGDRSVKWVPINVNGAWTWVHPEVAKATLAESAANSRLVETNSLITANEADLQVYVKTPAFDGTMKELRTQVNEALAPHGLQWNPATTRGTLADTQRTQTLAHNAHGQAADARQHYEQAVTSLDQAINKQAAMPFYPDGRTPVITAAGSNYNYEAEVAKGKQARAEVNKLFSDVDLKTKAGDKATIDFNVSITGAIEAPPGTLPQNAQPVEIEIGGQKLQVAPEMARAYDSSGDITALSNGGKPIRVQVDVTRPDGTEGREWRWVAPETALQSISAAQQLRMSEAYNTYFDAVHTDAALGLKIEDIKSRAIADYRQTMPHHFDPDGYRNAAGEHTGKLIDSEVVIKDGRLILRNHYENDVFTGEDGHVLEVALAVNPNDGNYTQEMRNRPVNREWADLAGPASEANACVASPLSAAKADVEIASLKVNQLINSGITENIVAIDKQLPSLRTDFDKLVQTHGTGTTAAPEGTLAQGETPVSITVGGQTIRVAPDVAEKFKSQGAAALTGSNKAVYADIEIPSPDGTTSQLRGWVNPQLALAGVRLADAEMQRSQLTQTKSMLDNSIAYNEMRLRNPDLLTTGTTEAEYLERDQQGALDGIYQSRYQNLLDSGFNNDFQALSDTDLAQTIERTAGIDPSTEDGREARQKIIDEIYETGGENAEVRVVPIFYSEEGRAAHQTALYAVKTDDGTKYIDAAGQKFDDLGDFQDNNRQFSEHGKLIVPKDLEMNPGADGRISLEVVHARNVSNWDKVVDPVVGIVGGVATVLSFTPLAPVAAPIAIGSGMYLAGRTAFKQADYLNHGGEWGDRESLMNMGMIAATALPLGGSALRSIGMVRAGIPASRALPGSIGALPTKSGTVTLAGREFAYNVSPYATQVANYTRTAGGLNMAAHGLDATAMTIGAPLVVQSGVDLAMHGGDMSGLELANSVLGLGTGVMGTGAGVRTIASYRPGRGTANPPEAPAQQVPVLEPDAIIIPGENSGPSSSTRSTPDLTPIAGRSNPDIVRVRAEDGQMVGAVIFGDQPASADAIFVPKHGSVPRLPEGSSSPVDLNPTAGEIKPFSDGSWAPQSELPYGGSMDQSKLQYTSGKDRTPFPATYLEASPDGKPLSPEQMQARYERESEYYSAREMAERYGPNGPQLPQKSLREKLPDFRLSLTFRVRMNTGEYLGTGSPTIGSVGFGVGTKTDFGVIGWSILDSISQGSLIPLKDALGTQGVVSMRAREYLNITSLQAGLWPVSNQTAFPVRAGDLFKVVQNAIFTNRSGYEIEPRAAAIVGKTPGESDAATVIEMEYSPSLKGENVTLNDGERDFFGVPADNEAGHVRIEDTLPFDRVMSEFKAGLRLPVLANHVDAIDQLPRMGYEKRPESPAKDTLKAGDVVSREAYDQIQAALGSTNLKVQFAVKDPQAAAQLVEALNRGDGVTTIHELVETGQIDPSTAISYAEGPIKSGMRLSAVPGKAPFEHIKLPTGETRRVHSREAMLVDVIFNDSNRLPGFLAFNPDKFVTSKSYKIKGKANEWRNSHLPDSLHSGRPPQSRSMQTDGNIYENLYGQYGTPATRRTVSLSTGMLPLGPIAVSIEGRGQYKSPARSEPRSIAKDRYTTMEIRGGDGEVYSFHAPEWLGRAAASRDGSAFMIPKGAKASLKRFLDDLGENARPDQQEMIESFWSGSGSKIVDGTFLRRNDAAAVHTFLAGYAERSGNISLFPLGDHQPIRLGSLLPPEVKAPAAKQVRSLSADDIAKLSRAELISIEPRHIGQLKPEQLSGLTPGQMALLTYDQIAALRPSQLRALGADQFNAIRPSRVAAIPPGRIANMNADQVAAFSPVQLQQLTPAQRLKITPDQLARLDQRRLETLGPHLSQMQGRQFAKLDKTQFGILSENGALPLFSRQQLRAIPDTRIAAIDVAKLSPEQVSWLADKQVAALTRDQLGAFTVNHIEALTRPQIEAMTPKQFEELSPGQFRRFTIDQFEWMNTDQINALSVHQLTAFKAAYGRTMTPDQRNLVDGALVYSRVKEHQAALETFGTMATSSYVLWSSLPPHWTATASGVAFALRGVVFSAQSILPNATASHTKLGRALNLSSGLSFILSSPGSAVPLIQGGSNPLVNGTFTLGNMIYGTKSTMQAFTGRTAMRLLGDHVGNAAYLSGSIAYAAQNLHSPLGWISGGLFTLGSAEFWASAIRADKLNRQSLPRTEADIAAAAKSDKRWAIADRLALGATFGVGMFLFAWDTLDGQPWKVASTDGNNPDAPDKTPSPDDDMTTPDDTPPPTGEPKKPDEPQFAITSEIGLSLREAPNAHADRLGVLQPDALVRETGPRETDSGGTVWAPVRVFDIEGKELHGWVRADYLAAHPEGAQDKSGRFNPELEKQGYSAVIVQNRDSIIGLAIHHEKSISETVALNLEHIANPSLLFAGDRVYLPR
ncbi:hypothetical protein KEU06_00900 [Pseudaminobacter sp. 19-2017]|uniref:LysM domain-containing protein n=1 Tax=Pseudaminobacter soli (ex Zhang et al. 2022) TaxID=2831468 RepID=A0A942DXI4_9HYPH|nr:hypothetical protein [Pseudaminobacter soli]MBS3647183.1 hypothetical protein [Pseudaminobacter soli]